MTEQPKKKVKKFGPKKGGATIAQSSKKRAQVPVGKLKKKTPGAVPPHAKPAPVPAPQPVPQSQPASAPAPVQPTPVPAAQPVPTAHEVPVPLPQPIPQPAAPPVEVVPPPAPVAPVQSQAPAPVGLPPIIPLQNSVAAAPPPQKGTIVLKAEPESVNAPTHVQPPSQALKAEKKDSGKTSQKKVLKGKPANQTDTEDLKDEVASYLEVCDSCLSDNNSPKDIIDVLHMLVMSLNFEVVTIALLDEKKENLISQIASRGYKTPPSQSVIECWEKAIIKGKGMDWKVLMKVAGDNQIDLTYWIVQEGLDSIGYVPIRDSQTIFGFIFVAAYENKKQSPLSSLLLDACGSRIGISNSLNINKGDWPEAVLNLTQDIRNQFSLLMGYTEMLRESASLPPEKVNEIIENCNKTIIESTQMLDSMTSEALGE